MNQGTSSIEVPVQSGRDSMATPTPHSLEVRFTLKNWRLWAASFGFFWSLYICGAVSLVSLQRAGGSSYMTDEVWILPGIQDTIFALLAPLVFVIAARHPLTRSNRTRAVVAFLGGGLLFAAVHVLLRVLCYPAWNTGSKTYEWALFNWSTYHFAAQWVLVKRIFLWDLVEDVFAIYLPIVVIAHAFLYYQRFRERELRAVQLQTQLSDARLLALKNQLQPHFLFNTLHSISSLMLRDVRSADTMIARLSDLLRMSLQDDGEHLRPLTRELDFTNAYLDIEKIRFGERLQVAFDIPAETLDLLVPHFLLQPLVENSIKHGISKSTSGGEINIVARIRDGKLLLKVTDKGLGALNPIRTAVPKVGIGLKGTFERLQTLYGEEQHMEARPLPGGGFEVTILLPFRRDARLINHDSPSMGVVAIGQF
jgi:two-component system, LytTR family, sensor kinase